MRIVFMGSPEYAIPTLRNLLDSEHEVIGVVTQPDKPAGRGRAFTPPPVKTYALERGLTVLQPVNVSAPPSIERLQALAPDLIVIAAYGQILRQSVLDLPARACLNVHASLLPRWRGASPIAAAILAGDESTGVTIMEVVRALDAGPILSQISTPIAAHDTAASLEARLAELGASLLMGEIEHIASGTGAAKPQDDALATYAPQLKRRDALIDWSRPAVEIWRQVRAYNPWPVAYATLDGADVRIWEAWPLAGASGALPGAILPIEALPAEAEAESTFTVQTGDGRLGVIRAQRTGKRALSGAEFLRGLHGGVGARFGEPNAAN